jgi:hypothetical protein
MEVEAGKRDITKRTFASMSREAQVKANVERANMVADIYATQATAQLLQGNIEQATKDIDKALNSAYEPIRQQLQMEMMFFQRNGQRLDAAQNREANARMEVIRQEQREIDRAISLADAAVMSGGATADDIQQLTDPNATPTQQANIAMGIIGRKAREEYNLEKAIKGRQYDLLGLELQTANAKLIAAQQAEEQGMLTPEQFDIANDLRNELNGRQFYKDAQDLEANTGSLLIALEQEDGVSDISAINTFQRLVVDPGVAVREGDVALLQSAMSFTDQTVLRAKGLMIGDKLTPTAREQMKDLVSKVYDARIAIVDENSKPIRTMAQEQGIDYGKYIGKNFASYYDIIARINPETVTQWGIETDNYLDNVTNSLLSDPTANPFGVSF